MQARGPAIILLLFACVDPYVIAQSTKLQIDAQKPEIDVLEKIPVEHRQRLVERLTLVVEKQSEADWDGLYGLLSSQWKPATREEYLKQHRHWGSPKLAKFTVEFVSTQVLSGERVVDSSHYEQWILVGCAQYGSGWFKSRYVSHVAAYWENGDWFFSEIGIVMESVDGPPASCKKKRGKWPSQSGLF